MPFQQLMHIKHVYRSKMRLVILLVFMILLLSVKEKHLINLHLIELFPFAGL